MVQPQLPDSLIGPAAKHAVLQYISEANRPVTGMEVAMRVFGSRHEFSRSRAHRIINELLRERLIVSGNSGFTPRFPGLSLCPECCELQRQAYISRAAIPFAGLFGSCKRHSQAR